MPSHKKQSRSGGRGGGRGTHNSISLGEGIMQKLLLKKVHQAVMGMLLVI